MVINAHAVDFTASLGALVEHMKNTPTYNKFPLTM